MIDLDPKERQQIERDLATLRVGMTQVTLSSNLKGVTIIDQRIRTQGEPATNVYGPFDKSQALGIRQGHHIITARAASHPELIWEVDAAGTEMATHVFEFPKEEAPARAVVDAPAPPPPERPIPRSFWYAAGGTGVLVAATAVTGLLALGARSSYDAANDGTTPEHADDLRGNSKTLNITTDVLLATTVVGAAVTVFLYVTRPEKALPTLQTGATTFRFGGVL
jgi:hypothetical protein